MKSTCFNLQVIGLCLLTLIPWPGPTVFKISCPRDNARIVRKIIQSKWTPILQKYKVSLPLECPFHAHREIFGPQQAAKHKRRPSQWTCGLCGKSFFEERFLDAHFDNRHADHINMAEDAICLADYCDIMRCDVLLGQDPKSVYASDTMANTDIEIWKEASGYTKALVATGPRDVAKYSVKALSGSAKTSDDKEGSKGRCSQTEAPHSSDNTGDGSSQNKSQNNACSDDLVDSALPAPDNPQQRMAELQKLKSNCKPEELVKLKTKCEILVRDCIASLLIQLSDKDFKEVEDELNRAVCWYLTCDRYWEDSHSDIRSFPWGLLCMIIMVLSLGICLCYYIIWVLFDLSKFTYSTDDVSVTSTSITDRSTPSPAHHLRHEPSTSSDGHQYTEDYYTGDKDNEYIYVTYPPDLKRRLLESCYNRTTRL